MAVILAAKEAEIRRLMVQSQSGQIVLENLFQKYSVPKRGGRIHQVVVCLPSKL
jgi:hypothetical protein